VKTRTAENPRGSLNGLPWNFVLVVVLVIVIDPPPAFDYDYEDDDEDDHEWQLGSCKALISVFAPSLFTTWSVS
jgi:hypothetical protein